MTGIIDEKSKGKQDLSGSIEARARAVLKEIYHAAIHAVQPALLLKKKLKISDSTLLVEGTQGQRRFSLTGNVYVAGVGKGVDLTAPLWGAFFENRFQGGVLLARERSFKGRAERISIAVGDHPLPGERSLAGTERCLDLLRERSFKGRAERISIAVGDHPLPGERSLAGTERCLDLLRSAGPKDWVVFFLMGGASSLLVKPAPGLTLEDKRTVTDLLLKSGMDISEMNCIRKHLSGVKAGGILRHAYPARVVTLAISDVPGDDPAVIGSAPSFHDPTTYRDAWNILRRYHLLNRTPPRARDYLLRGVRGEIPETLKPGSVLSGQSPLILLANNREALAAAKHKAESLGFKAIILTAELSGDNETRARELCSFLKQVKNGPRKYRRPHCFLLGGETTVRVRGKGMGGRNQEFALVSALELTGCTGLSMLSAGSDGSDGPTSAAGAFTDGGTISRARALGLDPYRALRNNDSYNFFSRLGELFCPGPTGTNVLDFKIVLLY